MADFCPRMSQNFAEIDQALVEDKAVYGKTHLLSVSFDPAYDTPAGAAQLWRCPYTGRFTEEEFRHWEFAAPSEADLPKRWRQYFDVGVTGNDPADADAFAVYDFDWQWMARCWPGIPHRGLDKPAEVAAAMKSAAG